ncbi:MAG: CD225/dispanin family protein [Phycisphaerales bacterium]|nr:CD225/dispanin family protein [Phycisphaerales bacterium]
MSTDPDRINISADDIRRTPMPAPPANVPAAPSSSEDARSRVYQLPEGHHTITCPYAQVSLRPGTTVAECTACGQIHLDQSWLENDGCTTYGCCNAPSAQPASRPSTAPNFSTPTTTVAPGDVDLTPAPIAGPVIQIVLGAMCLFFPVVTGIVALVYALKTNEHIAARQYVSANHSRSLSKGWSTAGWVIIAISVLLVFVAIAAEA